KVVADAAPVAPTHHRYLVDLQRIQKSNDIRGHQMIVERLVRPPATSMPSAVHGNDSIAVLDQDRNEISEIVAVRKAPVQEQNRYALPTRTPLRIPDACAIYFQVPPDSVRRQVRSRWKLLPGLVGDRGGTQQHSEHAGEPRPPCNLALGHERHIRSLHAGARQW